MTRDEQARLIAAAAIAHVSAQGYCSDADAWDDEAYCSEDSCTYCTLARAMEGYREHE